jgi:ABC-2 type transport system ATP-binding protein
MTDDAKLMVLAGVHKRYGAYHALRGLDLEAPMGAIGLLGPNGAGKSTLLKVMLGLLPFEGSAQVLGHDVRAEPRKVRARVGYMPERDCYISGMNSVEFCTYAAELSGLPKADGMQRAHEVLEFVGLADKRYQKIDGYSTGQKQRVKLAQALVHDPKLLLLDEPTNGLDPDGREEMLALIESLPERTGCAILLSSHLLHDVERVCSRAILLHQGEVVYSGGIEELRQQGQKDIYEVRVKTGEEKLMRALKAKGCTVELDAGVLAVHVPAAEKKPTDLIFAVAESEGLQVRHLSPKRLTLESAFVRAVNDAKEARA